MVRLHGAVICSLLIILAGCSGGIGGPQPTPTQASSQSPSPTATASPSPTPAVGTASYTHELRVRNFEENKTVDLRIDIQSADGDRVFNTLLTLSPSESRTFDIEYPEPGNYTVVTTRRGTNYTYQYTIEEVPPSYEIIVSASDGEVGYVKSSP